jgi:hypothetical protein
MRYLSSCSHLHNGLCHNISTLITNIITFYHRTVHIHQYVYVSFVFACYSCQVTLHPSLTVTLSETESFRMLLGITLQFVLTLPQQFTFFIYKSLNKWGEEKETVPAEFVSQIPNLCSNSWHNFLNCTHCSTCTFLSLPKHTDMFYVYKPQNNRASSFWLQIICVSFALSLSETFLISHKLTQFSSVLSDSSCCH